MPRGFARALRGASDAAYRPVRQPVEGTMLSVAPGAGRGGGADPRNAALAPVELLRRLVERGEDALARTPEQLAVLREAGVVDAGGAGLLELVRGLAAALAGEPPARDAGRRRTRGGRRRHPPGGVEVPLLHGLRRRGRGPRRAPRSRTSWSASATRCSSSATATALKIHVHTDDPGRALALGTALGAIEGVEIANMHRQTVEREERLLEPVPDPRHTLETGVVAVVPGAGNRRLFESYGAARVLEGGQTMNPSTGDLLAAIEADAGDRGARPAEQLERDPLARSRPRPWRRSRCA